MTTIDGGGLVGQYNSACRKSDWAEVCPFWTHEAGNGPLRIPTCWLNIHCIAFEHARYLPLGLPHPDRSLAWDGICNKKPLPPRYRWCTDLTTAPLSGRRMISMKADLPCWCLERNYREPAGANRRPLQKRCSPRLECAKCCAWSLMPQTGGKMGDIISALLLPTYHTHTETGTENGYFARGRCSAL